MQDNRRLMASQLIDGASLIGSGQDIVVVETLPKLALHARVVFDNEEFGVGIDHGLNAATSRGRCVPKRVTVAAQAL
jgi:hypothetical protein